VKTTGHIRPGDIIKVDLPPFDGLHPLPAL